MYWSSLYTSRYKPQSDASVCFCLRRVVDSDLQHQLEEKHAVICAAEISWWTGSNSQRLGGAESGPHNSPRVSFFIRHGLPCCPVWILPCGRPSNKHLIQLSPSLIISHFPSAEAGLLIKKKTRLFPQGTRYKQITLISGGKKKKKGDYASFFECIPITVAKLSRCSCPQICKWLLLDPVGNCPSSF